MITSDPDSPEMSGSLIWKTFQHVPTILSWIHIQGIWSPSQHLEDLLWYSCIFVAMEECVYHVKLFR